MLNLITCAEMVICSVAQSIAFTYKSHLEYSTRRVSENPHHLSNARRNKHPGFCDGLFSLLTSTTDVIDDTRNTFIKSYDDMTEKETQLDELMRCRDAFNWSDEELLDPKDRGRKSKRDKSNLPKVNGGKGQSLSMQAFTQIRKTMSKGDARRAQNPNDFVLRRRKSDGDGGLDEEHVQEFELQDRSPDKNPDQKTTDGFAIEINLADDPEA